MKTPLTKCRIGPRSDICAAELSVLPGCGQLYKGHYLEACGIFALDFVLLAWLATLIGLAYAVGTCAATLGAPISWTELLWSPVFVLEGLLPALLFALWAAGSAFYEEDLRHPARCGGKLRGE